MLIACCCLLPLSSAIAQIEPDETAVAPEAPPPAPMDVVVSGSTGVLNAFEHVHHAYAQVLNVQPVYEDPASIVLPPHCIQDDLASGQTVDAAVAVEPDEFAGQASVEAIADTTGFDDISATLVAVQGELDEALAAVVEDDIEDCPTVSAEPRLIGYDVEYRYRGEVFLSRLSEYPGDRLRIRVAIAPIELGGPQSALQEDPESMDRIEEDDVERLYSE